MKLNVNKIIRAVALITALCAVLCACGKKEPTKEDETTTPSSSATETTQSTTVESTTAPVTTEPTTAEHTTVEHTTAESTSAEPTTAESTTAESTTEKVTSTKPSTTATSPDNSATEAPTQTTKPAPETTTRHENPVANALLTADKMVTYRLVSKDEINKIAAEIADNSEIYYVRLQDGTSTYYMAVDLQTAQAIALSNPQVLRELCRQLDSKQQAMAGQDEEFVLMDYTHLVGELEVHYLGYLLTGALGAEDGALASFYRSCKVADLNIDESRFGPIIDIIGTIYG